MEKKLKHLEMLQAVINRMAGNLFLLKGWTISLIVALFALSAKDANQGFFVLAYFPTVLFWLLDGYFLALERRFRALYDHVRILDESQIDFSMDTRGVYNFATNSWLAALVSRTLAGYYLSLMTLMYIAVQIIEKWKQ